MTIINVYNKIIKYPFLKSDKLVEAGSLEEFLFESFFNSLKSVINIEKASLNRTLIFSNAHSIENDAHFLLIGQQD